MKAYRIKKKIAPNGALQLNGLPFKEGELVEVIILAREEARSAAPAAVRGKVIEYLNPTEPVAQDDWEALQ